MQRKYTSIIAAVMFIAVSVILQFYIDKDLYFNITHEKYDCVVAISVFALAGLGVWAYEAAKGRKALGSEATVQKMTLLDWSVLAFGASSVLNCILVKQHNVVFTGSNSLDVGTLVYITGVAVYFLIAKNLIPKKWMMGILVTATTVLFAWSLANQCKIDTLGWHRNIDWGESNNYVSTLGNVNAACLIFGTVIPMIAVLFLYTGNIWSKRFLALAMFVGIVSAFSIGSEGILLAYAFMAPVIAFIAFRDSEKTTRLVELLFVSGLGLTFYHYLHTAEKISNLGGIYDTMAEMWIGEIVAIVCGIAAFALRTSRKRLSERPRRTIGSVISICCVVFVAGVIVYIFASAKNDPNFGTGRGAIWAGSFWSFFKGTLPMKIFGRGNGLFDAYLDSAYQHLMNQGSRRTFTTCHNILLQVLLSQGIIGFAALMTGIGALIADWFKRLSKMVDTAGDSFDKVMSIAGFTGTVSCFGMALIESVYPNTVVFFFLVLALSQCAVRRYKSIG